MQLILKNFGPIKRGNLDLTKKFYLFVGPNNSGKTYVSQLLWCIFNEETIEQFSESATVAGFSVQNSDNFEITTTLLDSLLEKFAEFLKVEILPKKLKIDQHSSVLGEKFSMAFQYDLETIRQQPFKAMSGVMEGVIELSGNRGQIRSKSGMFEISKPIDSMRVSIVEKRPAGLESMVHPGNVGKIQKLLQTTLVKSILHLLFNQTYHTFFLPAGRIFVSSFYYYVLKIDREEQKKFSQQLLTYVEQRQAAGGDLKLDALVKVDKRPYNEIVSRLVEKINELWESEPTPYYAQLVAEMGNILGGEILVEKAAGIGPTSIALKMSKPGQPLPMYLSSSAVNQLAPLYLYFQYWAKEDNNFLMIDEPEENLHPRHQIALCNILLKFVMGNHNRVLISTHSPLIAENVNNYLSLNLLKGHYGLNVQEVLNDHELALRTDLLISPEEVGIYFFNGREVMDYEANEYGVYFRDFREVIGQVERASKILTDYIYMKAHEGKGEGDGEGDGEEEGKANVFDNG